MTHTQAIIFDLDNTLINRNSAFQACIKDYFLANDFDESSIDWEEVMIHDQEGHADRLAFCDWLIQTHHLNTTQEVLWQYIKSNIASYISPDPKIIELLALLSSSFSLKLLTNGGTKNQQQKLINAELKPFFRDTDIYISEATGYSKPGLQGFENVLNDLHLPAEKVMMVGDQLYIDLYPAKKLAMQVCWIHNQSHSSTPPFVDLRVSHPIELKEYFKV
ncbi:HAD family hydrolase [Fulvivirga sediminis]|uniref:HAD family hydrolase n=1 Tax=Fulvivirga sediminis TaxID=2803949 RepID=A0A937F9C0_9BACT|nr:HAD family hydrolase [Fulvivirga sediminis]MBL3656343.1 HAD family hydrolase [Fulvivirga sediminis]